ncbi:MAG TPA: hypothetical protein VK404_10040 [Spirosoma sp.]|nr:hypothetical protein [Spirosoma sp.]
MILEPNTEPLARLTHGGGVVIGRRKFATHTSVVCVLPLNGTDGFRAILRQAGCHIYNDKNYFTYANNGRLLLHTKDSGPRTIHLRSDKTIPLTMPPDSTYLLKSQSGKMLMFNLLRAFWPLLLQSVRLASPANGREMNTKMGTRQVRQAR